MPPFIIFRRKSAYVRVKRGAICVKDYIEQRALMLADYIIENQSTVRAAAKNFALSKSSVHKDVTDRLLKIDPTLARTVKAVLDKNKAERHIRGGMATKRKYEEKKRRYANI